MHTEPRTSTIDLVVVHVNVGGEVQGGAKGLANYLKTQDAGYHAIVDDKETILCATDNQVVWGAGGVNSRALHVCIIGYADQTAAQWRDPYSSAAIQRAAAWTSEKCKRYGLPTERVSPRPRVRGVCGHVDVSAVYAASDGHYDPGPNFPWRTFLDSLNQIRNPLAFILPKPGGGAWWAHRDGSVDFIGKKGKVTHGGMIPHPKRGGGFDLSDVRAFEGRTVKKLKPRKYRRRLTGRMTDGYTIVATSGEEYVPKTQR